MRDLGERVRRAWGDEHYIGPPAELYVQDRVADLVCVLQHSEKYTGKGREGGSPTTRLGPSTLSSRHL